VINPRISIRIIGEKLARYRSFEPIRGAEVLDGADGSDQLGAFYVGRGDEVV